jgi:hypothetical protein
VGRAPNDVFVTWLYSLVSLSETASTCSLRFADLWIHLSTKRHKTTEYLNHYIS